MADLSKIIERLEKATGPDRALDEAIFEAVHGRKRHISTFEQVDPSETLPPYTSSVDAALTLVPEGWTRAVDATAPEMGIDVDLYPEPPGIVGTRGAHNSESIATCIAALKARSTTND